MKQPLELDLVEQARLRNFIKDTEDMERKMAELDRKDAFKKLPVYKKVGPYFLKGLGLLLGLLLVLALLGFGK